MKIALVSPYDFAYPGGVTNHIENLSREFILRGHTVTIVAPSSRTRAELNVPNFVPIGRPIPIPSAGSVARISISFWRMPRVQALFDRERFDVVHTHEPLSPLVPTFALLCSRTLNIATFHAYRERSYFYPVSKSLFKPILSRLHGRIAVSQPALDFASRFFPADYHIIPNGIDLDHFQRPAESMPQFLDGKTNLLFVGRAEQRKGLKYLIAAYARLKWQFPNLRLIVVGPGNPDSDSQRIMGERSLHDIAFVGKVPYKDLPRYYQSAHIFCAPSTGKESLGIVLLEAMAAGIPVVASDIAGYATVIRHGVNGILAKPKDDESLAQGIRSLLERPELGSAMRATARLRVQDYAWPRVAGQVLEYYATVRDAHVAKLGLPQVQSSPG